MSSAEQNSPNENNSQAEQNTEQGALKSPPKRPTLVSPPKRPSSGNAQTPAEGVKQPLASDLGESAPAHSPAQETEAVAKAGAGSSPAADNGTEVTRYQPIAPPSEPMQYRAIGLVRGTYQPTEADQLNRGALVTEDGAVIDAVLLGRVTSLVKKHIDLAAPHLWVVYPRTRRNDEGHEQDLHLQIVGVWEPETLGWPGEAPPAAESEAEAEGPAETAPTELVESEADTAAADQGASQPTPADFPPVNDNFFSIRGEVVRYSPEDQLISVKILQGLKRSPGSSKPFKVNLQGTIEGRTVGYFWDFKAKREQQLLVLEEASVVGIVPPKKRAKKKPGDWSKPHRGGSGRPMPSRRTAGPRDSSRPRKVDAGKDLGA